MEGEEPILGYAVGIGPESTKHRIFTHQCNFYTLDCIIQPSDLVYSFRSGFFCFIFTFPLFLLFYFILLLSIFPFIYLSIYLLMYSFCCILPFIRLLSFLYFCFFLHVSFLVSCFIDLLYSCLFSTM